MYTQTIREGLLAFVTHHRDKTNKETTFDVISAQYIFGGNHNKPQKALAPGSTVAKGIYTRSSTRILKLWPPQ